METAAGPGSAACDWRGRSDPDPSPGPDGDLGQTLADHWGVADKVADRPAAICQPGRLLVFNVKLRPPDFGVRNHAASTESEQNLIPTITIISCDRTLQRIARGGSRNSWITGI